MEVWYIAGKYLPVSCRERDDASPLERSYTYNCTGKFAPDMVHGAIAQDLCGEQEDMEESIGCQCVTAE